MLFFVLSAAPAHADITTGLVGHWKLDEGSGTTTADSSGNGLSGTLVATPAWTTGKFGNALSFDGVTRNPNQQVTINDAAVLRPANVTIAAWVKSNVPSDWQIIALKRFHDLDDPWNSYGLDVKDSKFEFFTSAGSAASILATISTNNVTTDWTHVVGTYDGTVAHLYINGVLNNSRTYTQTIGYSDRPFTIGNYGAGWEMNGTVDDVRVYNRALTAADVAELYDMRRTNRVRINGARIGGLKIN